MSKSEIRVARRYAKALFESCSPASYDLVSAALKEISSALDDNEIRKVLIHPGISEEKRISWVESIVTQLCPEESTKLTNLFSAILQNRRLDSTKALSDYFESFVEHYKKLLRLEVISARELSQQERENFANQIKERLPSDVSKGVSFDWQTEADLLGGVQVRIGDKILDGSVAGAIQKIASQLLA